MRRGEGCPICAEGRTDDPGWGLRFFAGEAVDAYLKRTAIQRGYSIVVWRGRHVAEPTELSEEEASLWWRDLLAIGRALEQYYDPVKLNYELLGNSLPHLHAHVVPRYADDPRPGWPFPFPDEERPPSDPRLYASDVGALRSALSFAL